MNKSCHNSEDYNLNTKFVSVGWNKRHNCNQQHPVIKSAETLSSSFYSCVYSRWLLTPWFHVIQVQHVDLYTLWNSNLYFWMICYKFANEYIRFVISICLDYCNTFMLCPVLCYLLNMQDNNVCCLYSFNTPCYAHHTMLNIDSKNLGNLRW
jgi:hypothetical protein